jgi:hypothetical protein
MFKAPNSGAYSEIFGLLSPNIPVEKNGALIYARGRIGCIPDDIKLSLKSEEEGGVDLAKTFADWCESEVRGYKYWLDWCTSWWCMVE